MSIIFGIRKSPGASVSEQELCGLALPTARYAADGLTVYSHGSVGMGFQPYHTHQRSRLETGLLADQRGSLVAFDGRLDNSEELCRELQIDPELSDTAIIRASYLRWGRECFSHFTGDWALALWSDAEQMLYLARDHAGTRSLYFNDQDGTLVWSTYLDSFFIGARPRELDEQYVACYLAACPVRELTPYKGIRSVSPAHYRMFTQHSQSQTPHWQWMSNRTVQYQSDREYEEHFFALFEKAVERRDQPGTPILAQLSGGMDSTSIVCMSDYIRRSGHNSPELLDTVSFFDDSEPNWNEKPFFTLVEAHRGKTGFHIETSFRDRSFYPHDPAKGSYFLPGVDSATVEREQRILAELGGAEYRCVLSGVGGDELLGGVPIATPELGDYLVAGRVSALLKKSLEWCLIDRTPIIHILLEIARSVVDLYTPISGTGGAMPPWMSEKLRQACVRLTREDTSIRGKFGVRPSSVGNGRAWWSVMETLPHLYPGSLSRPEYRYPFLDKDLVDFLLSIPREQVLRPGYKRSLMRRSLSGIVPREILDRRRKGYQIRGPLAAIQQSYTEIDTLLTGSRIAASGLIDMSKAREALELTGRGCEAKWWRPLMRAINLELWLRGNESILAVH
jgi:asparagine synthase (glutamine-hydrolysing)